MLGPSFTLYWQSYDPRELGKELLMTAHENKALKIAGLLTMAGFLNSLLFLFNLLPFPPLDGSSIWRLVLRGEQYVTYLSFADDRNFWFLGWLVASAIVYKIYWPVYDKLIDFALLGYHPLS
ncbi:MAG: site-2 protease family protein [Pirellulales bacterium]